MSNDAKPKKPPKSDQQRHPIERGISESTNNAVPLKYIDPVVDTVPPPRPPKGPGGGKGGK